MAKFLARQASPRASINFPFCPVSVCRMNLSCQISMLYSISRSSSRAACSKSQACNNQPKQAVESAMSLKFWNSKYVWQRASINTLRCLIGCSLGDFSAMWFLQASYPDLAVGLVMGISMITGLSSSMLLQTVLLRLGRDRLTWATAAKTAAGMSMVSMLGMETVQNLIDYHLTGGIVALDEPKFWMAAAASALGGFLAPLPYNYSRLKRHGKSCH